MAPPDLTEIPTAALHCFPHPPEAAGMAPRSFETVGSGRVNAPRHVDAAVLAHCLSLSRRFILSWASSEPSWYVPISLSMIGISSLP